MADPLSLPPLPVNSASPAPAQSTAAGSDSTTGATTPSFAATLKEKIDQPASAKEDSAAESSAALAATGVIQPPNAVPAPPLQLATEATDPTALITRWHALPDATATGNAPVAVIASALRRTADAVSPTPTFAADSGAPAIPPAIAQIAATPAGQPAYGDGNDRQTAKFAAEPAHGIDKPAATAAISAATVADVPAIAQSEATAPPIATTQPPTPVSGERALAVNAAQPAIVTSHPDQPGWAGDLGQRLTWMIGQQRQQAELVLTPPHLGTLEISLKLDGNQASASFVSAHPAVREALDQALPRLREMLAEAGVTLGQTHVGAEQRQTAHDAPAGLQRVSGHHAPVAAELRIADRAFSGSRGLGLVDVFA